MTSAAKAEVECVPQLRPEKGERESHLETLIIHELSSRKFTAQNDLYQYYRSQREVILIESKFTNYKCLHVKSLLNL